jgi:hypothetical protein
MVTNNINSSAPPNPIITTAITTPIPTPHTDHRSLNDAWRQYFAQVIPEIRPPILGNNLNLNNNIPWGPDAHKFLDEEDCFRIAWQNQNGFNQVNNSLPSWAATINFLETSLFGFTEPNLQWDKTILANAKDLQ